jgi:WhiB family redox-sensing transcriptional regulator
LKYPESLRENAACREAAPSLFDAVEGILVTYALSYCERCSVVKECDTFVRPRKSFFDGVVAGKLWRNGRIVDPDQDALFGAVD